ncbi:TadE/TadG family type IV pilus assembly protein [Candidatus Phyllobacterium onerii]|jgi:Flp pilus assembly protein TadG|uniref:TadE/TadG family type IV pilus assembly protein n=1 Tax=Candidatus Phyllobacterium onerii TaxID=3020828 RepID=UPI003A8593A5
MFGKIHKLFGNRHAAEATDRQRSTRRSTAARFFANKRGTVAIEFAMIALPFFLLIFAMIEVSLSFTAQQVMANATDDIARQLRTGEIKTLTLAQLKQMVCSRLLMPAANCPDLVVDLRTYTTFALVPKTIPLKTGGDVNSTGFTSAPGGASTINQLRVFYRWPIFTDLMKPRIATIDGTGKILLFSSATWRNEPYL